MTDFSDFEETVKQVTEMLEQLDTETLEQHEIPEHGVPPEERESKTGESETSSGRPPDEQSNSVEGADNDLESSPDETKYQPHQYIIQVATPVGPDYVVRAVEGEAYFDVIADYSLVPDIAEFYDSDELKDVSVADLDPDHPLFIDFPRESLEEMEEEGDEETIARLYTAVEALDNLDEDIKADIIYQLTDIFTTAPVKYVVNSTREDGRGGIKGFQVFYRIFPYEEAFNLNDLNDVIEQVRMATQRGKIFLKYSFQLDIDFGEETGGGAVQANPPERANRWGIN
jgi:hypothetical protein